MDMGLTYHPEEKTAGFAFKVAGDLLGDDTPERKKCPHCGAALVERDVFCPACGKRVSEDTPTAEKTEKKAEPTLAGPVAPVMPKTEKTPTVIPVYSGKGKKMRPEKKEGPGVDVTPVISLEEKRPAVPAEPKPEPVKSPVEPIKPVMPNSRRSTVSSGSYRIAAPASGVHAVKRTPSAKPMAQNLAKPADSGAAPYSTAKPAPKMHVGKDGVVLSANIRTKKVKNNSGAGMKELIRDIRMDIREGTLVALLGTAGAGKSTVMNCLNGMDLQGVQGTVLYRGVDLMKNFEQMKYLIGSVPQKKIFHAAFTPEEEFTQAAMLRLPADTTDFEIRQRVNRTLEMLSMNGVRKTRNSKLSGGEQTRVNVGIELVADRDLLCLDEPDQGLSPNYKHELFEIMRNLAHTYGKTVLSIIHDVSEIDLFDQVVMLAKVDGVGRLAFSGTPAEAREFFGADIRDAYALLERDPKRFVK